ncbi:MAG: RsmB/NOP family class I SAM-dependent RNA methyltransferase [Nanoarchaeota archaeon]|nr:RsmB/NOP family class I SAM-dependent RNA methyltransferase [Nanoarchaeota archaeon]
MNFKSKSQPNSRKYEPKPEFVERIKLLLPEEKDYNEYVEILNYPPVRSIRCNTLKISPEKLKQKLEEKGWTIKQPWHSRPEIMIVENALEPGELGRALEHMLGYYYIQELASMLPIIALKPKPNEIFLDLCSAPGSKTTQAASEMLNTGTIIANELSLGRIKILASNLEKNGVTNAIITKKDGIALCKRLKKNLPELKFDKILVDAPCSGEGTLRSSPITYQMWSMRTVYVLSQIQKQLFASAFGILKVGGEMVYSTCTHAPEENEQVVNWALNKFDKCIKIEKIEIPVKSRPGITKWKDEEYKQETKLACRIYPQDNNTEGFFLAKFKKLKEIEDD